MSFLDRLDSERLSKPQPPLPYEPFTIEIDPYRDIPSFKYNPDEERKREAVKHRKESGIGLLVGRLGRILAADTSVVEGTQWTTYSRGFSEGFDFRVTYKDHPKHRLVHPHYTRRGIQVADLEHSVLDVAVWDSQHKGTRKKTAGGVDAFTLKYLVAETSQSGIIYLRGRSVIEISGQDSTKPGVLEEALERTFQDPAVYNFTFDSHPSPRPYSVRRDGPSAYPHLNGRPWS